MSNSQEVSMTIASAVLGGVAGFLFFTARGRSVRRQIEPALDDFVRELKIFRTTVQKATGVANESWRLLSDTLDEAEIRHVN
jgi:hypothetical protein